MVSWLEKAKECYSLIAQENDEVILFLSTGKDSLVLLDLAVKFFKRVHCVHMYFVPNLLHVEKYLEYVIKKYSNVDIIKAQHWANSNLFRGGFFCMPDKNIKIKKLADIESRAKSIYGDLYIVSGIKASDSMNRNLMLRGYEGQMINRKTKHVYPLSYAKKRDILKYIQLNNLPKPIQYSKSHKSQGVGLNLDCFLWLRDNQPEDLETIYKYFPLSRQILFDHDHEISEV